MTSVLSCVSNIANIFSYNPQQSSLRLGRQLFIQPKSVLAMPDTDHYSRHDKNAGADLHDRGAAADINFSLSFAFAFAFAVAFTFILADAKHGNGVE